MNPASVRAVRIGIAAAAAVLAALATTALLARTGHRPAAPLDDAYIHFQYARSFAELTPLQYTPGATPSPGASSYLWVAFLAICWGLGFRGDAIVWPAWLAGWALLALLADEVRRASAPLLSPWTAWLPPVLVLCCGGLVWSAGSAMAILPLAWVLLRSARAAAEWLESRPASGAPGASAAVPYPLWVLSGVAPLVRPEGALASLLIGGAIAWGSRRSLRLRGLLAVLPLAFPLLLNAWLTGELASTTLAAKWLPFRPYAAELIPRVTEHLRILFTVLFAGEQWAFGLIPEHGAVLGWLALPSLLALGAVRRRPARAICLFVVALGLLIPVTYHSFLWNRLRYLWPFAGAWFVALGAVAELVTLGLGRLRRQLQASGLLLGSLIALSFARLLPDAIDDLGESAAAILHQQVSLGEWARAELPAGARLGVNDAGAIAYYSERRVFDAVGLTTQGEARYWAAGAGSRFEHYEELHRDVLPTHYIVYPHWWQLPQLLGPRLTHRTVHASILGGPTMIAQRADYRLLGSGALPRHSPPGTLLDELDVAHLAQERAHDYALGDASQQSNQLGVDDAIADGGRLGRHREAFAMTLPATGWLVARLSCEQALTLRLRVDGADVAAVTLHPGAFQEVAWPVSGRTAHRGRVCVTSDRPFGSYHYWSYADGAPPGREP